MSNWLVKKKHMRIAVNSQAKKKKMSATEQSREEEDKDNYGWWFEENLIILQVRIHLKEKNKEMTAHQQKIWLRVQWQLH